jgi:hypothetical protein
MLRKKYIDVLQFCGILRKENDMRRMLSLLIVTCTVLSLSLMLSAGSAGAATEVAGYTSGYAHGGSASAPANNTNGSITTFYGPIAPIWEGCDVTASVTGNNSTASTGQSPYVSTGSAQDVVTTTRTSTNVTAQAQSTIHSVSLLNGLITASEVVTVSNSSGTAADTSSDENGSGITGLIVDGIPVSVLPAPNTTMQLPGLGYVILNEQNGPYNSANASSDDINMIDVRITNTNSLGIAANTDIIVGHASSNFFRTLQPALTTAASYGLDLLSQANNNTSSLNAVGETESGCGGGNMQNNINNSNYSTYGSTGAVNDSSSGQIGSSGTTADGKSSIVGLNLFSGLIQGDTIDAEANAAWNNTGSASTSVTFTNMHIAGSTLASTPASNTRIPLPGIGYAVLNEQSTNISSSGANAAVNAIDVYVTQANSFGLSAGSNLIIGYAFASVVSY